MDPMHWRFVETEFDDDCVKEISVLFHSSQKALSSPPLQKTAWESSEQGGSRLPLQTAAHPEILPLIVLCFPPPPIPGPVHGGHILRLMVPAANALKEGKQNSPQTQGERPTPHSRAGTPVPACVPAPTFVNSDKIPCTAEAREGDPLGCARIWGENWTGKFEWKITPVCRGGETVQVLCLVCVCVSSSFAPIDAP